MRMTRGTYTKHFNTNTDEILSFFKTLEDSEIKRADMKAWIEKWQNKYAIRQIFVKNAWAVEYKLLIKA